MTRLTGRASYILRPNDQSELYDCRQAALEENNLFGDLSMRSIEAELQARLTNWYVNTSGVPPAQRDSRGAPILDRPAELNHVLPLPRLLDH